MQTCDVTEVNSGATFTIRCDDIILDGALAQELACRINAAAHLAVPARRG